MHEAGASLTLPIAEHRQPAVVTAAAPALHADGARPRTVCLISAKDLGWSILRAALKAMPDVHLVAETTRADDARQTIPELNPDAIIAAATVERVSCIPLLAELRTRCPRATLVVIATRFSLEELDALAEIGISAYLLWSELDSATFEHCVAAAVSGTVVMASRTAAREYLTALCRHRVRHAAAVPTLSAREQAVLRRLAEGRTREQIAAAEALSLRTVERTIATLQAKLKAPSTFLLGARAAHLGLVS